ncbi:MAG: twin-arginine translocase subunit TatC [Lentisphaeria bacterium]|nr:twin-arginine translocase subunit TatC [Lentisphaeria bacterium]
MSLSDLSGGSLLDHLDALRGTLLWCLGSVILFAVPGIIFAPELLLRYVKFVCPPGMEMHYFTPFEPLIVELELGLLLGVFCAMPVILYKLSQFIAPGLYTHEKRWGLLFLLVSLFLLLSGALVGLLCVIPIVMQFSGTFAADGLKPIIGLAAFLRLSGLLAAGFALVFELPAVLLLAIRFRLVSVEFLRRKRPYVITGLFIAAAVLTPPDIVSQLLMGLPGWILFELTLLIGARIVPPEKEEEEVSSYTEPQTVYSDSENAYAAAEDSAAFTDDAPYRQAGRKKRRIRHL